MEDKSPKQDPKIVKVEVHKSGSQAKTGPDNKGETSYAQATARKHFP
jgi:hypothetical protein